MFRKLCGNTEARYRNVWWKIRFEKSLVELVLQVST